MPKQTSPIRGKVALVLSSREVAINKGSMDGVEIGMIFNIMVSKGTEIKDPDTGELLGSVELPKTMVKVTSVQDRVSVASTFRTNRVNVGGSGLINIEHIFQPPRWEIRAETLKTEEAVRGELDEVDTFVKIGDPVVEHIDVAGINAQEL